MRGIIIASIVGCAALIGLAVFFSLNSSGSGPRILPLDTTYEQRVTDGYWKRGAENPKVTLVEYLDFQCPACQAMSTIVEQATAQTADFVQYQVHIYPLIQIHDKATAAAKVAEAAGRQGKFWQMSTLLFAHQKEWEAQIPLTFKTTAEGYATNIGLNLEQFQRDVNDSTINDAVDRDVAAGNRIPVQGTPTFIVNGQVLTSYPTTVEEFVAMLKTAGGVQ